MIALCILAIFGAPCLASLTPKSNVSCSTISELPNECECLMNNNYSYSINCQGLNGLDNLLNALHSDFANLTLYYVSISASNIPEINANAFQNLTIARLIFMESRVRNISSEAFSGIKNLNRVIFYNVTYLYEIPEAISVTGIRFFFSEKGDLTSIGRQLQNLSTLIGLSLSYNAIRSVDPEAFLNCIELRQLNLKGNPIQNLDSNLLRNNRFLQSVDLSNNHLTSIKGLLEPCRMSLQRLLLLNNRLSSVGDLMDGMAGSLKVLNLAGNNIPKVTSNDFLNKYQTLNFLYLNNASLEQIEEKAFDGLPQLNTLGLTNNNLTTLPDNVFDRMNDLSIIYLDYNRIIGIGKLFQKTRNLKELHLESNRIENIEGAFYSLYKLQVLSLIDNKIVNVPNGTFVKNYELQYLFLRKNLIESLDPGSFVGLNQKLTILDLSFNHIRNLGGAFSGSLNLKSLTYLLLSHNQLQSVTGQDFATPSITKLDLDFNEISFMDQAFVNLRNLKILSLRSNNLTVISEDNFPSKIPLRLLIVKGTPLSCDCRLLWAITHHIHFDRLSKCARPSWLKGQYFRKMTFSKVTSWKEDCPEECGPAACHCSPNNTEVLITVSCTNRNLTSIPQMYPARATYLDFSVNKLTELPNNISELFPNAQELDLRRNNLVSLMNLKSLVGLKVLDLSENNFTRFPSEALSKMNLTNTSLSLNPWICDCDTDLFRNWLLKNYRTVSDINDTRCSSEEVNGKLKGKLVASLLYLDLCPVQIALYTSIAIAVLAILLVVAGSFIGYIRHQMPIKVWLYTHGLCLRCVKEEDLDENKDFDAFIAFSSKDNQCVISLIEELENKPPTYRLCVHYRDFPAGRLIIENISKAVGASKKIIVLLSKDFLESDWGMQEFREAHRQTMEEKVNRIVMVLVGELPQMEDIPADVRTYMMTATYLSWNERSFWEKLRYAMPKQAVKQEVGQFWTDDDEQPLLK